MLSACAHPARSFRLVSAPRGPVLIPPGVKDSSLLSTSVRLRIPGGKACTASPGGGLRIDGKNLRVSREALSRTTADELNIWTAALEKSGCLGPGDGAVVVAAAIDALPLELPQRRVLRGESLAIKGFLDLTSRNSLRVVSPVFRPGATPGAAIASQSAASPGPNGSITLTVKANPDLTGYEVAWYDIRQRADGSGFRIVPRTAEVHIAGQVEQRPGPQVNQFVLDPAARWFRHFVMTSSSRNDYDIVLLSASTASELETRTEAFRRDAPGYLRAANRNSYAAMTREIGVNAYIRVKVKGVETDTAWGNSIRQVIEEADGRGNAAKALPRLSVFKPYGGGLRRVEWDAATEDVLNLALEGGEEINW